MRKKVYLLKKLLLVVVVLGEDPFITHLLQLLERDFRGSKSGYYIRSVSQDDEISGVVVLVLCSFRVVVSVCPTALCTSVRPTEKPTVPKKSSLNVVVIIRVISHGNILSRNKKIGFLGIMSQ